MYRPLSTRSLLLGTLVSSLGLGLGRPSFVGTRDGTLPRSIPPVRTLRCLYLERPPSRTTRQRRVGSGLETWQSHQPSPPYSDTSAGESGSFCGLTETGWGEESRVPVGTGGSNREGDPPSNDSGTSGSVPGGSPSTFVLPSNRFRTTTFDAEPDVPPWGPRDPSQTRSPFIGPT